MIRVMGQGMTRTCLEVRRMLILYLLPPTLKKMDDIPPKKAVDKKLSAVGQWTVSALARGIS